MSPKPVDFERALRTLRRERPTPEQTERLTKSLHLTSTATPPLPLPKERGFRKSLARPLTLTMITTALALVLVVPSRTSAGAAWAQTVANTLDSPAAHSVERFPDGKKGLEEWRFGRKRAHVLRFRDGKPGMEWRDDGVRLYNYAAMFTDPKNPNARRWGMVSRSTGFRALFETPYGSPERLLKTSGVEVLAHEEASGGWPETYRLRLPGPLSQMPRRTVVAELDAAGRIRRLTTPGEAGATTIEYPTTIPDEVFAPRPHAILGVDVYDLPEQSAAIGRTLRKGLGKQGPVILRLVTVDGYGTLWAFWSGALPDARMSRPVRIPGVRSKEYATKKALTSDWKPTPSTRLVPNVTGGRLGGMSFVPQAKLGSTVDLDVPYPGGIAHFRKAPILRVGLINHYERLLGIDTSYAPVAKGK